VVDKVFSLSIKNFCQTIMIAEKQERFQISGQTHHEFIDHAQILALAELGIAQCGLAMARDMFSVYRKHQQKHMLLYTVKGKGWLQSGASRYVLEPGSLIYVPAKTENGFGIEQEEWQLAWLFLEPGVTTGPTLGNEVVYRLTPTAEPAYAAVLSLVRAANLPSSLREAVAHHAVGQLKLLMHAAGESDVPRVVQRLRRVFDAAQRQLHKDWSIEQLAQRYPCSAPHFHRLCLTHFGHGPKSHLTKMRMEYAARLLTTTEWPIQHIGEMVGYPNAANFSTGFKRWYGLTPRSFRQTNNGRLPGRSW